MNQSDEFILTHYTDITEAKQREVRLMQAMAMRRFLADMITLLRRAFQRSSIHTQASGADHV